MGGLHTLFARFSRGGTLVLQGYSVRVFAGLSASGGGHLKKETLRGCADFLAIALQALTVLGWALQDQVRRSGDTPSRKVDLKNLPPPPRGWDK